MRNQIPGRRRPWRPLLSALQALARGKAQLLRHTERPWASVTFAGTRHTIVLGFTGADAIAAGEDLVDGLPEHEFAIPGQLVADAAITSLTHDVLPEGRLVVEIELLLLEDA
jgi:hypothetical protein